MKSVLILSLVFPLFWIGTALASDYDSDLISRLADQGENAIRLFFTHPPEMLDPAIYGSEKAMIDLIEGARNEILFEAYYIQKSLSTGFVEALKTAANRGFPIRIILAELPSKDEAYADELRKFPNVQIRFFDLKKENWLYGSVHTKTIMADGRLTTFGGVNYSYMGLHENRETNVVIDNSRLAMTMRALFERDWEMAGTGKPATTSVPALPRAGTLDFLLVEAAPVGLNHPKIRNIQPALKALIRQAKHEIVYEIDYYTMFGGLHDELLAAAKRGVNVKLLTEERSYSDGNPLYEPAREAVRAMSGSRIHGRILSLAPYGKIFNRGMMHSKSMVVDGNLVFIGSNNISRSGLLYSRETGVIFRSATVAAKLLDVFKKDFDDPLTLDVETYLEIQPSYTVEHANTDGSEKTIRIINGKTLEPHRTILVKDYRVIRRTDH